MNIQQEPWLTIITVSFDDIQGALMTLRSIEPLKRSSGDAIEVIVIDGGTSSFSEATQEFRSWAKIISEPDEGIYDAMNKGLHLASGQHIWFLNGGDLCLLENESEVRDLVATETTALWIADYVLDTGSKTVHRQARGSNYIYHGLPTSHQAILFPGPETKAERYDLAYSIVGDYQLTARLYKRGIPFMHLPVSLAQFTAGGTSQQQAKKIASQAWQVQKAVLRAPLAMRAASQALHFASRALRSFQTRGSF